MDTSDVIALVAVIIATGAGILTWRIHFETGARVDVKMNVAAYEPSSGTLLVNEDGGFKLGASQRPRVELAQVVVENRGRTAVTVTEVQLRAVGGETLNRQVIPRRYTLRGQGEQGPQMATYFRLEPYDRRTLLFDFWQVVDDSFAKHPSEGELNIHAEVKVAGLGRTVTSEKRDGWRINSSYISAVPNHSSTLARNVILTEVLRQNFTELSHLSVLNEMATDVEKAIAGKELDSNRIAEELQYTGSLWPTLTGLASAGFPVHFAIPVAANNIARSFARWGPQIRFTPGGAEQV